MSHKQIKASDLGELKQQEVDLLFLIRTKYRFGNLEIIIRDGVPCDVLKTIERVRLGALSPEEIDEPFPTQYNTEQEAPIEEVPPTA